jgi:hypothetical protein
MKLCGPQRLFGRLGKVNYFPVGNRIKIRQTSSLKDKKEAEKRREEKRREEKSREEKRREEKRSI